MKKSIVISITLALLVVLGTVAIMVSAIEDDLETIRQHNTEIDAAQVRVNVVDEGMRMLLDEHGVPTDQPDPNDIQPTDALYTLILDPFERAGEWYGRMPNDQGVIKTRELWGAPRALNEQTVDLTTPWPRYRTGDGRYSDYYFEERLVPERGVAEATEDQVTVENLRILGVKVAFHHRGYNWFAVYPPNPYVLDGEVKTFSLWVCGRNKRHELYVIVKDLFGSQRFISLGKLNFLGWKNLITEVPVQITQYDYRYDHRGLTFEGFLVRCNLEDSWGEYYMYLDNLEVTLSRYYEEGRDVNDPLDNW